MKIFITGASGKIGNHIANYFLKKNFFCILNSRKKIFISSTKKNYKLYKKNILDKSFIIPDCDVVIHTAAITPEPQNLRKVKLNEVIDKKIFFNLSINKNIKKLIFISTAAVYHKNNFQKKVNEKSKLHSKSEYSNYKLKSEKMFLTNKKIKIYNIRIPGLLLTGKENNFMSNLIKQIKNKKKITLFNPNQMFNNILLIKNLNFFLHELLLKNFKSGTILLGSEIPLRLIKITKIIAAYFKVKKYINWKIDKKKGFYLNIHKATNGYNFSPINTRKSILEYLKITTKQKNVKK